MNVELLAPAGSIESFYAAVNSGADSVYLGGKFFNARNYSRNFDKEEMKHLVKYAHNKGVKVYVTMNTVLKDTEITDALNYAVFLYENDVDALIVQDLGFLYLVNKYLPDFSVNISTQAAVYDEYGVKFFEEFNAKKVILAREMSILELRETSKNTETDLEVFIHGALCTSYSGQCYMSSFLGGRSGNRGKCAQPCRLSYSFYDKETEQEIEDYKKVPLLSLKDFIAGESIYELIEAGIKTFKIEGRMKGPAYTAAVVEYYRQIIDNYYSGEKVDTTSLKNKAMATFSRGYTNGYLKPSKDDDMYARLSSGEKGENIEEIEEDVKDKAQEYSKYRRKQINFSIELRVGRPAVLILFDGKNTVEVKSKEACEVSIRNFVTDEIIKEQLSKLGNTIYELNELKIEKDQGVFIRKSTLNQLRRDATEILYEKCGKSYSRREVKPFDYKDIFYFNNKVSKCPKLSLKINSLDELKYADKAKVSRLYVPYHLNAEEVKDIKVEEKYLWIPSIVTRADYKVLEQNLMQYEEIFDGVCVNNPGSFYFFKKKTSLKLHCGPFFNIINTFSTEMLKKKGAESFTFSVETNIRDMENMMKHTSLSSEIVAHEYVQLMVMKNCPMSMLKNCKNLRDCEKCSYKNRYRLKDRKGVYFNIERQNKLTYIYNSVPLTIIGTAYDFVEKNIDYFFLDTKYLEDAEEIIDALYCEINGVKTSYVLEENKFTRGHYLKNVL
ncbi:MAG: U32 family peptidase [Tissierellia bacterium]|nr:U32 family peptidase [Tissierellia bacterium]